MTVGICGTTWQSLKSTAKCTVGAKMSIKANESVFTLELPAFLRYNSLSKGNYTMKRLNLLLIVVTGICILELLVLTVMGVQVEAWSALFWCSLVFMHEVGVYINE